MNEKPIIVGDLVVIIKPKKCCSASRLGFIFTVEDIWDGFGICMSCGSHGNALSAKVLGEKNYWVDINRLKRIPPLGELTKVSYKEPRKIIIPNKETINA
jgi:hypothetical protein